MIIDFDFANINFYNTFYSSSDSSDQEHVVSVRVKLLPNIFMVRQQQQLHFTRQPGTLILFISLSIAVSAKIAFAAKHTSHLNTSRACLSWLVCLVIFKRYIHV